MQNKILIGLDPSYTGTGIAIINEENKLLYLTERSHEQKKGNLRTVLNAADCIADEVSDLLRMYSYPTYIGQEYSTAYTGFYIAELWLLTSSLFHAITNLHPVQYHFYKQSYITTVLGKHTKEDTIFFMENQIIPIFQEAGYTIIKDFVADTPTKEKKKVGRGYVKVQTMTNNEADALIYAIRQFILYSDDLETKNKIITINERFNKPGEN